MPQIKIDESMLDKLFAEQFKTLDGKWYERIIYWLTDSRYRTKEQLSAFVARQLETPHMMLRAEAREITRYRDPDRLIVEIVRHVLDVMGVEYKTDKENYDAIEMWADAVDVMLRGSDDCDGINLLIYVLARLCGIPSYALYIGIVDAFDPRLQEVVGHFCLFYYSFSKDKLFPIDGTYYPTRKPLSRQRPFETDSDHYVKVHYVFNERKTWVLRK